jgi:hypothetical protein
MYAAKVPVASGRRWVGQGFGLFRKAPAAIGALTFLYLVTLLFSGVLPVIGAFAPLLLTPLLTVGMTDAARLVDQGESGAKISPIHLFQVFRQPSLIKSLILLGVLNAAGTVLALGAASLFDSGALFDLIIGSMKPEDPRLQDGTIITGLVGFLVVYAPLQMLLWYAPLLVAWEGVGALKACFFSWVAVWRNKWAFLNYAVSWIILAISVSVVLQIINRAMGGSNALMTMLLVPASLLVLSGMYSSYWPAFRDVFRSESPA